MKITYTYAEATATLRAEILRTHVHPLGLPYDTITVDIAPENTPTAAPMHHLLAYAKVVDNYANSRFWENKIPAIKMMRELIPGLGLADAKYIVEANAETVLTHFNARQTLIGYALK